MKIYRVLRPVVALILSVAALSVVGCGYQPYKKLTYNYAGRPYPPSGLGFRVIVSVTGSGIAGTGGSLQILDASRDIRYSVYNVNSTFSITGYSATNPIRIINYPEQVAAYVYSQNACGSGRSNNGGLRYGTNQRKSGIHHFASERSLCRLRCELRRSSAGDGWRTFCH